MIDFEKAIVVKKLPSGWLLLQDGKWLNVRWDNTIKNYIILEVNS